MSKSPKKYRFLVSAYMMSLIIILDLLFIGMYAWLAVLFIQKPWLIAEGDFWPIVITLAVPLLALVFCEIYEARLYFGWYTISDESVTLHAPFRRPLTLRYEDVRYVGAGRNFLSVNYAYWLYLSMDPVPLEELEDMRRFKLTNRGLRIAYSKKVFAALYECLPPDLARQLDRSKTTLRAWGGRDI